MVISLALNIEQHYVSSAYDSFHNNVGTDYTAGDQHRDCVTSVYFQEKSSSNFSSS